MYQINKPWVHKYANKQAAQHREYSEYFIITLNRVSSIKILNHLKNNESLCCTPEIYTIEINYMLQLKINCIS